MRSCISPSACGRISAQRILNSPCAISADATAASAPFPRQSRVFPPAKEQEFLRVGFSLISFRSVAHEHITIGPAFSISGASRHPRRRASLLGASPNSLQSGPVAVVVAWGVAVHTHLQWPPWGLALALFVLAALANVLYSAAYPVDVLIQRSSLRDLWRRRRWILWLAGMLLAVALANVWIIGLRPQQ